MITRQHTPLVSVILPTYNRANMVRHAIESVLEQTYTDFEVIVVDDGSTDNTMETLAPFAGRIHYIRKDNEGFAALARNAAMKHARGEFIALIDSDDTWTPTKLETQMRMFQEQPDTGLVSGHVGIIDTNGHLIDPGPVHKWLHATNVELQDIVLRSPLHASTLLIRRNHMNDSLPFDPRFRICEDWHLCLTIAAKAPIRFVDDVIAHLRIHESNSTNAFVSSDIIAERLLHRLTVIEEVFPTFNIAPTNADSLQAQAIAQEYVFAAIPNYMNGELELGRQQLQIASEKDSVNWGGGENLVNLITHYANILFQHRGDAETLRFLRNLFNHAPSSLTASTTLQRKVFARTYLFILGATAISRGQTRKARANIIRGLFYDPCYLANRGVLSMLLKSVYLQSKDA